MRIKLDPAKAFNMDRINSFNNYETGLSASLGLIFNATKVNNSLIFNGQIFNKEENKEMPSNLV